MLFRSGGLHCATADVYREGGCEDYFPKQVKDVTLVEFGKMKNG